MFNRPRGPMDKASAYGAGDCRFESCRGHYLLKGSSDNSTCEAQCFEPMGEALDGSLPTSATHQFPDRLDQELTRHLGFAHLMRSKAAQVVIVFR